MSQSTENHSPSRRDFIKLAAASLGGTILTGIGVGCGGSMGGGGGGLGGPVGVGLIPNGYSFYRLFTPGTGRLPEVTKLLGGVINTSTNVLFYAQASSNKVGLYQLVIEYANNVPRIVQDTVLINQGDNLGGSLTVSKIGSAALSDRGVFSRCAAVVTIDSDSTGDSRFKGVQTLWHNPEVGFDPLVKNQDKTPDGSNFGAHIGDVAINNHNDVLFTADYSHKTEVGHYKAQGLFVLTGAKSSTRGQLLSTTGDIVAGANSNISQFGLCDLDDNGNYVAQFTSPGDANSRAAGQISTGIIAGRGGGTPFVLHGGSSRGSGTVGSLLGPRIRGGNYTAVLHNNPTQQDFKYNNVTVASTGGNSPLGRSINGLGPGAITADNLTHFLATVDNGMELVVSNGETSKTILKYDDVLTDSPTQIRGIVHGYHSNQSDINGNIVFIGEFADGSQSIVIGVPH